MKLQTLLLTVLSSGGVPAIAVSGNGISIASGDSSPQFADYTHFGGTPVGTPIAKTFTIRNTGNATLTSINASVSGNFTVTAQPSSTIAPGVTSTFTIQASASGAANDTGTVTISSNVTDFTFSVAADVLNAIYVAKTGNDSTGDGTSGNPYLTVNKALSTVATLPTTGNRIILVGAGTYNENTGGANWLDLNRTFTNNVYIQPNGAAAVTLTGNAAGSRAINIAGGAAKHIFQAGAGTLTITNNTSIRNIYCTNATGVSGIAFIGVTMTNNANDGSCVTFVLADALNCSFVDCTLTASGTGDSNAVNISGSSAPRYVDGFAFSNCTLSGVNFGLHVTATGYVRNLSILGGSYTSSSTSGAAIGERVGGTSANQVEVSNVTLSGVTVSGNGRGIEFGGTVASTLSGLTITDCDVDSTAQKHCGIYISGYLSGLTVSGGSIIGGETGTGFGGIYVAGVGNSDFEFLNADIASEAPDPVTNRVLALGIEGTDGVTITGCNFSGDGRAIAIQTGTINVLIENNTSEAEDMFLRVGFDGIGTPYSNSNIIFRGNSGSSLKSLALIVGEGVSDCTIENNSIAGGTGILRVRGHATNSAILVQNNSFTTNPAATGINDAIELYGANNLQFLNNTLSSEYLSTFKTYLQDTLDSTDCTLTGNDITQSTGQIYDIDAATLDTGVVFDSNIYRLEDGAILGDVLGTTGVDTLAELQAAWAGYGAGTNDANSTVL